MTRIKDVAAPGRAPAGAVRVVELIGSPRTGSRSRTVAAAAVNALLHNGTIRLHERLVLDLAEIAATTFTAKPAIARAPVPDPFTQVRRAGLLVVATPTVASGYSGLLQVFLEQLGPAGLTGITALPVVATTTRSGRPVATALTRMLTQSGATVAGPAFVVDSAQDPARAATGWAARYDTRNRKPTKTTSASRCADPPGPARVAQQPSSSPASDRPSAVQGITDHPTVPTP